MNIGCPIFEGSSRSLLKVTTNSEIRTYLWSNEDRSCCRDRIQDHMKV